MSPIRKPEYGATPSLTLTYQYGYDASGNRTSIQWPDAWTATYTFDAANRMSSVSFTGGSGTWAYDSQSRPTSFTRSNGTTTTYSYELDSDLATLTHAYASGSPTTATFTYSRDKAGLITYRGNPTAYDWTPTLAYARSYGPANPLNQVSSEAGTSLAFDVRGNMTSDGTWTFAYDQRNRMISATKPGTTASYDYDGDDRRTKKTVNGVATRIVWSGDAELAEADASGAILRRYVPGAAVDTPQAMVAGTTVTWLHADGQGSIINVSTSAGVAGTPITYSPYGEIGGSGALPSGLPFGYTGRYLDAETGLWYYRARYYHPRLGQFLQTDPIGTKDDPNLYLYVGADPVNETDPSGECPACIAIGAAGGLVAGVGGQAIADLATGKVSSPAAYLGAAAGGAVGGAVYVGTGGNAVAAGMAGGAVSGGVSAGFEKGMKGGSLREVVVATGAGAARGAVVGGATAVGGVRAIKAVPAPVRAAVTKAVGSSGVVRAIRSNERMATMMMPRIAAGQQIRPQTGYKMIGAGATSGVASSEASSMACKPAKC